MNRITKLNKLIKYYFYQLFNSLFFILFFTFIPVATILTILLPYFLRSEILHNSSFIISIIFQVFVIILLLFLSIKLFNENKYNLCDIKLLGKNFFRYEIFWSKFLVIFICSTAMTFIIVILSSIVMAILQINQATITAIFVSNLIGLIIDILFFIPISILLATLFGKIWSPIISLLVLLMFPITSCIGNFLLTNPNNCNQINKNINDYGAEIQYSKIYQFNSDNKLLNYTYAYNYNYSSNYNSNINTDISNSINYINKLNFLLPGNITLSTQQAIYSNINNNIDLSNYLMYSGSLSRYVPTDFKNLSNFINSNNSYILTNMNDNDFFNKNSTELSNMIIDSIQKVINKHRLIGTSPNNIMAIYNSLINNDSEGLWNIDNLNPDQMNFIFDLIGSNDSNLFYVWYYNEYLTGNLSNLIDNVKMEFSEALAKLLNYLWFTDNTYFNLILVNSNNDILKQFQNKLKVTYPINTIYKSSMLASQKDLDFFEKKLVIINNSIPFLLNKNGVYVKCDPQKFKQKFNIDILENQNDWINFLTKNNIPTVSFLSNIYNQLKSIDSSIQIIYLQNNNFDINSFNQIFMISIEPINSSWIWSIITQLSTILLFTSLSYYSYKKIRLG